MRNLRRSDRQGDIVFTTHVTNGSKPILRDSAKFPLDALIKTSEKMGVSILAYVVMSDHFHVITRSETTPTREFFRIMKGKFTCTYRSVHRVKNARLWQYRYWDRIIRNEDDLRRHIDHIHYNPVKHGLTKSTFDWQYTSIHDKDYAEAYGPDWGRVETPAFDGEFGE
jgi:putative transposase